MFVCIYLYIDLSIHLSICVCIYVFMYVCMYACMHVCMYACMHVCMYVWFVCIFLNTCEILSIQCSLWSCLLDDNPFTGVNTEPLCM